MLENFLQQLTLLSAKHALEILQIPASLMIACAQASDKHVKGQHLENVYFSSIIILKIPSKKQAISGAVKFILTKCKIENESSSLTRQILCIEKHE